MATVRKTPGTVGAKLRAAVDALDGAQAKVGWFPSAKYEDGTPVALVAVVQEYGSPKNNVPPRPYMRTTQDAKKAEWKDDARRMAAAVAAGKMAPGSLMAGLAMKAEGDVRQTISEVLSPPLSERTIAARRSRNAKGMASDKPLVDTGLMLNTLTSQVTRK